MYFNIPNYNYQTCGQCGGNGINNGLSCWICGGSGMIMRPYPQPPYRPRPQPPYKWTPQCQCGTANPHKSVCPIHPNKTF